MREAATKLEELMAGSRSQEIEQARSGVSGQDAELQKVKNEFDRDQVLYKNGAISASQFDAAQAAYDARKASYVNAREALSLTKEGPQKGRRADGQTPPSSSRKPPLKHLRRGSRTR